MFSLARPRRRASARLLLASQMAADGHGPVPRFPLPPVHAYRGARLALAPHSTLQLLGFGAGSRWPAGPVLPPPPDGFLPCRAADDPQEEAEEAGSEATSTEPSRQGSTADFASLEDEAVAG